MSFDNVCLEGLVFLVSSIPFISYILSVSSCVGMSRVLESEGLTEEQELYPEGRDLIETSLL